MNRRTVLQSVSVTAIAGLAGCVGAIEDHFTGGVQSPVPVEITNEGERSYNVHLEAHARDAERKTYDHSYAVTPNQRVSAPHLDGIEQRFRVVRFGGDDAEDLVETDVITETSRLVLIRVDDDDLELEITADEEEAEELSEGEGEGAGADQVESEGPDNGTDDSA